MMKLKHQVTTGVALVSIGFFGGALVAQDHKGHDHGKKQGQMGQNMGQQDMASMMDLMRKAGTPGKQHAKIAKGVGKWDTTIKFWMDPSAPPMLSQGTYEIKSIMGGRYTEETARSEMMGMPFEGKAITGYDNVAGHYFSIWIDNFGTGVLVATGDYNDKGQLVLEGEYSDPMSPSGKSWMREVITDLGPNRTMVEMYSKKNGELVKDMEIKSTRAR